MLIFFGIDSSGKVVVKYNYDAWGNHTITASNQTIANLNPFRYRGYFYDTDTGLYYLKTRYYDPEVGRFLNMDSVDYADPETLGGLNLYSYCNNNPVMYVDPDGHSVILTCFIIGVIICAAGGGLIAYKEASSRDLTEAEVAGWVFIGVVAGAVIGGAVGAGIGALAAPFIGGAGASMAVASGEVVAVSGAAASTKLLGGIAILLGLGYLLSKHNPGMSNKPPVSWTNIDEGLNIYKKFGGDSNKSAEYLLNQFRGEGNWHKGAGTEFNALKKWFDRIIRLLSWK